MLSPPASATEQAHAIAEQLLQRHGVLTREHALAEGVPGGFVGIYPVLRSMEEAGRIRRGYFVEGLGGAQFALPGAVDRLRGQGGGSRSGEDDVFLLAATDPACAYGVTAAWPEMKGRPARAAGAYVVLDAGELRLFVERGGRSILTNGDVEAAHVDCLREVGRRRGKLEVLTIDAVPVGESPLRPLLEDAGFAVTHRGLVLYAERASGFAGARA
jgi:ATP-dependent Lhr-like helicase